jgi:hypothetical protein
MSTEKLTGDQIAEVWRRVAAAVGDRGHLGWDWPTLLAVFPAKGRVLKRLNAELRRRNKGG